MKSPDECLDVQEKWTGRIGSASIKLISVLLVMTPLCSCTILTRPLTRWIASTPGLSISSSTPFQAYSRKRQKPLAHGEGIIAKNELLIQSSEHSTMDYTGREEEEGTDSLLRHYVGVYDPKTGNLQLMEARKMTVRGVVRAQQADLESLQERGVTAVCHSYSTLIESKAPLYFWICAW